MNTDTPETDAEVGVGYMIDNKAYYVDLIHPDFARNLERQRNAAIKRLESSQEARAVMREGLFSVKELLEREQLRLAACGAIALADTPESAEVVRDMHQDYESAACRDVARRVDECIELRQMVRELRDEAQSLIDIAMEYYDMECGDAGGAAIDSMNEVIEKATKLLQ